MTTGFSHKVINKAKRSKDRVICIVLYFSTDADAVLFINSDLKKCLQDTVFIPSLEDTYTNRLMFQSRNM